MRTKLISLMIVFAFVFSMVIIISPNVSATNVMSEDWENGTNGWSFGDGVSISTTQSNSATHSVLFTGDYNGGVQIYKTFTSTATPLQVEMWVYVVAMATESTFYLIRSGTSDIGLSVQLHNEGGTVKLQWSTNEYTWYDTDTGTSVSKNTWHHFFISIYSSTKMRIFMDDNQIGGNLTAGYGFNTYASILTFYARGQYGGGEIYVDDIAIETGVNEPGPLAGTWKPTFTSYPDTFATRNESYSYTVSVNETANVTAINIPSWLSLSNNGTDTSPWILSGTTPVQQQNYSCSIQANSWNGTLNAYQNFTIRVYLTNASVLLNSSFESVSGWDNFDYGHFTLSTSFSHTGNNSLRMATATDDEHLYHNIGRNWLYPITVSYWFYLNSTDGVWYAGYGGIIIPGMIGGYYEQGATIEAINSTTIQMWNILNNTGVNNHGLDARLITTVTYDTWHSVTEFFVDNNHVIYYIDGVKAIGNSIDQSFYCNADASISRTTIYVKYAYIVAYLDDYEISGYNYTPVFTTTPITSIENNTAYSYHANTNIEPCWIEIQNSNGSWLSLGNNGTQESTHILSGTSPDGNHSYTMRLRAWVESQNYAYQNFTIVVYDNTDYNPIIPPPVTTYATLVSGSVNNSHPFYYQNIYAHGVFTYSNNGTRIANANLFFEIRASNGSVITSSGFITNSSGEWNYSDSMFDIRSSGWTNINGTYRLIVWFEADGNLRSSNVLTLTFIVKAPVIPLPHYGYESIMWIFLILVILIFLIAFIMRRMNNEV